MKYLIPIALFFLFASANAGNKITGLKNYSPLLVNATIEDGENFWSRVQFGGNIGLQFGNPTTILLSPSIGYVPKADFLDDKLSFGLGVTYIFSHVRIGDVVYTSNIYGGRVFLRYLITESIFAYSEFESLNAKNFIVTNKPREWVNSFFVGGGFLQRFSGRGGISITALYNLLYSPDNIVYASPWNIRIGFIY